MMLRNGGETPVNSNISSYIKSILHYDVAVGMSGLVPNSFKLAPNATNPRLLKISFQYILADSPSQKSTEY